jgi:hypothetical protein
MNARDIAAPDLRTPVIVSEFWANRRGESARVQLIQIDGVNCIDVRRYVTDGTGHLRPTPRGIALAIHKLPKLAAAIVKAERKARELGLIKDNRHEAAP